LCGQVEIAVQVYHGDDRAAQVDDAQHPRHRIRHRCDVAEPFHALHRRRRQRTRDVAEQEDDMLWGIIGEDRAWLHAHHARELRYLAGAVQPGALRELRQGFWAEAARGSARAIAAEAAQRMPERLRDARAGAVST